MLTKLISIQAFGSATIGATTTKTEKAIEIRGTTGHTLEKEDAYGKRHREQYIRIQAFAKLFQALFQHVQGQGVSSPRRPTFC